MLAQRRRRWASINRALGQRFDDVGGSGLLLLASQPTASVKREKRVVQ